MNAATTRQTVTNNNAADAFNKNLSYHNALCQFNSQLYENTFQRRVVRE